MNSHDGHCKCHTAYSENNADTLNEKGSAKALSGTIHAENEYIRHDPIDSDGLSWPGK